MLQTAPQKDIWVKPAPDIARENIAPAVRVIEEKSPDLTAHEFPKNEKNLRDLIKRQSERLTKLDVAAFMLEEYRTRLDSIGEPDPLPLAVELSIYAFVGAFVGGMNALVQFSPAEAWGGAGLVFGMLSGMAILKRAGPYIRKGIHAIRKTSDWYVDSALSRLKRCKPHDRERLFDKILKTMNEEREELKKSIKLVSERLEKTYGREMRQREDQTYEATLQDLKEVLK